MMSDDDEVRKSVPAPVQQNQLPANGSGDPGGVVKSLTTGFRSVFRAKAFSRYAEEHKEADRAIKAKTGVINSAIELHRAMDNFRDLDAILEDDQADRDQTRTEKQFQRDKREGERQRERASWDALDQKASADQKAQVEQAGFLEAVARTGREIFEENIPTRKEQARQVYRAQALDDEKTRAAVQRELDSMARPEPVGDHVPPPKSGLDDAIRTIEDEIAKHKARGSSDEIINSLASALARLLAERGS